MAADGGTPAGFSPPQFEQLGSYLTSAFFRRAGVGLLKGLDPDAVDPGDIFIDQDPPANGRLGILTLNQALEQVWHRRGIWILYGYRSQEDFFRDVARHWGVVAIEKFQEARRSLEGKHNMPTIREIRAAYAPTVPWLRSACDAAQILMPDPQDEPDRNYLCGLAESMERWGERAQPQDAGATKR